MTGTAETEAQEFAKIYELDVVVVPTNRQLARVEEPDDMSLKSAQLIEIENNPLIEIGRDWR